MCTTNGDIFGGSDTNTFALQTTMAVPFVAAPLQAVTITGGFELLSSTAAAASTTSVTPSTGIVTSAMTIPTATPFTTSTSDTISSPSQEGATTSSTASASKAVAAAGLYPQLGGLAAVALGVLAL